MGNLGFDTDISELESRCKSLLQECGYDAQHFSGVASTRRESGSACEIVFATPQLLREARIKIMALRKQIVSGRTVWLDAKESRQELKPNRMMHRAHELLEQYESAGSEFTGCGERSQGEMHKGWLQSDGIFQGK